MVRRPRGELACAVATLAGGRSAAAARRRPCRLLRASRQARAQTCFVRRHPALGQLRATRSELWPDVPTVTEQGFKGGVDFDVWFGLVAPAGTPQPILSRLHAEFTAALNDEGIRTQMRNIGMEPVPSSTEAFDTYMKSETRKWGDVIRKANIKLQ